MIFGRRRRARLILHVDGKCLLNIPTDQLALLAEFGGGEWRPFEQLGLREVPEVVEVPYLVELIIRLDP